MTRKLQSSLMLLAFGSLCLTLPETALAGPWDVGGTKPSKDFKLKFDSEWKHNSTKDSWSVPIIKFGGPINSRLSFEVANGYGFIKREGQDSTHGLGDFSAKLMWGLMRENAGWADVLLEPKVSLDTGDVDAGTGSGASNLKLPLRIGKTLGSFYLTGEVRYTRDFSASHADTLGYGALLEYKPSPQWVVGVDLFNDRPVHEGDRYHLRSNFAVKYKPGGHWEWQGLIGRTVENKRGIPETKVKINFIRTF